MSLLSLLKMEFMKQKRGFALKIVFIIPLISCLLFSGYVYLKYNTLTSPNILNQFKDFGVENQFDILLFINHQGSLWFMLSSVIFIFLSVSVNHMEDKENCWKLMLSMPVKRTQVYLSKWIVVFIFSCISIFINAVLFTAIIFAFKLGRFFNLSIFLKYVAFEILCSLSIISFQQFISNCFKNLLVSFSIAFIGIVNTFMFWQSNILSNIIPYMPPLRALPLGTGNDAKAAVLASIVSGAIWFFIGITNFNKMDIC